MLKDGASLDLTLAKTLTSTGPYFPGSTVTFELLASNLGPGAAQPAIGVKDKLPAGLQYVSASGTNWTCSNTGQDVSCTRAGTAAALASGDAADKITVTAKVAASAAGTLTNVAYVAPAANETLTETNPVNASNGYDDGNPATLSNNDASAALKVTQPPTPVPTLGHGALGLLSLLTLLTLRRRRSV